MYEEVKSIPWSLYLSRGLSAWGDRLWSFGIGIFMNVLGPKNFRLVAVYGFSTSMSVIIFGAVVGSWVDKTNRLTSAKTFLAIQNLVVAVCCTLLAIYFGLLSQGVWPQEITEAVPPITIIFAVIANLASVGTKIAVEKDWVVVIAGGNSDKLAKMNATFRTIDLLCLLVAPLLAGLLFDFTSNIGAAIFIAVWNMVSVVAEYALLLSIYIRFPTLANKTACESGNPTNPEEVGAKIKVWNVLSGGSKILWQGIKDSMISWKVYLTHSARTAGIGLAFLYMTVLGFDNITYGYCIKMCIKESIIGAMVGISAVFGVCGSTLFPFLRKSLGVNRTGTIGFACLISVLSLSVISVGLPGTLFEPHKLFQPSHSQNISNETTILKEPMSFPNVTLLSTSNNTSNLTFLVGSTEANNTNLIFQSNMTLNPNSNCFTSSYVSIGFFLTGVVAARFGLWLADLSINQILQEEATDENRGKINGVQSGLNSFMNTLKYILVIIIPETETFGWLIIMSYLFACFGALSYVLYAERNKIKPQNSTEDDKEVKND